jgi:hypothetical protein
VRISARGMGHLVAACAITGLVATGCGGSTGTSAPDHEAAAAANHDGMADMPTGDGLTADASGFRFAATTAALPAGQPASFQFRILGADGKPVTAFEPDQTKLMHFYLIRSDLTGFQHIHATMSTDGTWTALLAPAQPGTYRAYASFITKASGRAVPLVLSQPVIVPGTATMTSGQHALTATVSKDGRPVTDLQPYLDTYAHLTAFHDTDLAFAHLHPHGTVNGNHGGPTLSFETMLPKPGNWRLFLQFQTAGVLHTAAVTVSVG